MHEIIDLTGRTFGHWTVVLFVGRVGRSTRWKCRCACGEVREVAGGNLTRTMKPSRSCGCVQADPVAKAARATTHGLSRTSEVYGVWKNMRNRCLNERAQDFARYGGRGIRVCSRWYDFATFASDMGPRPHGMTIERKDVNGHYEPSNCHWATQTAQQRNRRNNKLDESGAAEIRKLRNDGLTLQLIADRFEVSKRLVQLICQGKAWA